MPILKGLMNYMRFSVAASHEIKPEYFKEKFNLFRFKPLNENGHDDQSLGWVPFLSEYDDEKPIETSDFLYDDKIILTLRMDKINLPKELLKIAIKKAILSYEKQFKKYPDKAVKKEIEIAESKKLRAKVLPKCKVIEAVFSLENNQLRIFSRSASLIDKFVEIFEQTFLLKVSRCDFAWFSLKSKNNEEFLHDLFLLKQKPLFSPAHQIDIL